jgi:tRNA threonylcarbamoyladenosine biosynthesis protein TsaE
VSAAPHTTRATTATPAETQALGEALGRQLRGGDFVALVGPLGAGKTHFMKGVALGLGVPAAEPVVSPTFVLVREYVGRVRLYHLDAYRLRSGDELRALGLEEMQSEPDAIVAIEWADRTPDAVPADACWVELQHAGGDQRTVEIRWQTARDLRELRVANSKWNAECRIKNAE